MNLADAYGRFFVATENKAYHLSCRLAGAPDGGTPQRAQALRTNLQPFRCPLERASALASVVNPKRLAVLHCLVAGDRCLGCQPRGRQ